MGKNFANSFTLIEMLVVIAIIGILAAMLMGSITSALESGQGTSCKNNLKNLTLSCHQFAGDHDGCLPGSYYDNNTGADAYKNDWIGVGPAEVWTNAVIGGTLWNYTNDIKLYRCPGLSLGAFSSGVGSNGKFDYVKFGAFTGARMTTIAGRCEFRAPGMNVITQSTGLFTEEAPSPDLNKKSCPEGHFTGLDVMASTHKNSAANVGNIDGTVATVTTKTPSGATTNCGNWYIMAQSGTVKTLGQSVWQVQWGFWGTY